MIDRAAEVRALGLGLLAAIGAGLAYAIAAEIIGLTFGLPVVAIGGGWLIGKAVSRGAWRGEPHPRNQRAELVAMLLGFVAWDVGLLGAYAISQALIPEASTALAERLSVEGFLAYFGGLFEIIRIVHLVDLALLAFIAGRSTR